VAILSSAFGGTILNKIGPAYTMSGGVVRYMVRSLLTPSKRDVKLRNDHRTGLCRCTVESGSPWRPWLPAHGWHPHRHRSRYGLCHSWPYFVSVWFLPVLLRVRVEL
jgi:hypothetical protein